MQPVGDPKWTLRKSGKDWRIGNDSDVRWIKDSTTSGLTVASAIPPVFADYATIVVPEPHYDLAVVEHLRDHSRDSEWWLGFLQTGSTEDLVFRDAPRVKLYANWDYVLVLAGPGEASGWRAGRPDSRDHGRGPDLIFPTDRSWVLSCLWDDDWYCVGGSRDLIDSLLAHEDLGVRRVSTTEDATPPGHIAY